MRATGRRLGNPAAEHAQGPPTNPVEMGLPDITCAVYRASQRPYRVLFESVWARRRSLSHGRTMWKKFATGPARAADRRSAVAGSSEPDGSRPAGTTFDQMAQSIAGYEASGEVTSFTSKFNAVLAN
jgi:cytochrome c peroxidase